jgi:AraC family transcriptional regulator, regulatory protein of adaptative response / methylated-DNA-[protein]-cysteine methyltransferase
MTASALAPATHGALNGAAPGAANGAAQGADAVRRACALIDAADERAPTLAELARAVGLSPAHFQRLFKRAVGLSPRDYAAQRRVGRVKALLRRGEPVAGALYEAGYGSSSRLYESAGRTLGMTPATYKKGGEGAEIRYAFGASALGTVLVASTHRGICFVAIDDRRESLVGALKAEFPAAAIAADDARLAAWLAEVLRRIDGAPPRRDLPLDVRATAFQWRVWQALSAIPAGETRSYGDIARDLGVPKAPRAVGRACATNPVSILVPCHRAVAGSGALTGYRWGVARKRALLAAEKKSAGS